MKREEKESVKWKRFFFVKKKLEHWAEAHANTHTHMHLCMHGERSRTTINLSKCKWWYTFEFQLLHQINSLRANNLSIEFHIERKSETRKKEEWNQVDWIECKCNSCSYSFPRDGKREEDEVTLNETICASMIVRIGCDTLLAGHHFHWQSRWVKLP